MYEPLRPYQATYVSEYALAPAWYNAWDPRLGKTRAEVLAEVRRIREKNVRKTLILGPKAALTLSWEQELRAAGFERPSLGGGKNGYLVPLQAGRQGKVQWVAQVLRDILDGAGCDRPIVVLFNYDILEKKWDPAKKIRLSDLLWKWSPHSIIVDEAHYIKTAGALRTRTLRRLGKRAYFRRCLSGTPDPQSLADFYAQYAFLEPQLLGTRKDKFLERYFVVNPFVQGRIEGVREENRAELEAKVFSVMTRVRARDYFGDQEMPDVVRRIPWLQSARELYDKLAQQDVLRLEQDGISVDGTHLLTKMRRFFQLCEGFLVNEQDDEIRWLHHSKHEAIAGDLQEILAAGKRAVVSFLHTPDGAGLAAHLRKTYGEDAIAHVDGSTPDKMELLSLFDIRNSQETPKRVLVVQESVGGVGISLARAEHLLFCGWSMDGAMHEQMRKRVWDPSRPCTRAYYCMSNSADNFRHAVVAGKRDASIMVRDIPYFDALMGRV